MLVALSTATAWSQTDFLTFTGVWSTVPVSNLVNPSAVTGDANGNLYITDSTAASVIKFAADGTQTLMGSGLNVPLGIASDPAGNLYVTSSADSKVYKITSGGTQTAIGLGWSTPVSVAVDSNGNVFVTDLSGLSELTVGGAQNVLVSSATIRGVAVDSANDIYFGDNVNNAVFEIPANLSAPVQQNFANYVQNLYVDGQGKVFMAETSSGVFRADDPYADYTLFGDTVVSNGVWGDSHQNLYIADGAGQIEKLAMGPVDFGSINVCPTGATVTPCASTQTLHYALDSDVNSNQVMSALSQGVTAQDYTFSTDGCSGNSNDGAQCSVVVSFAPLAPGLRTGAVEAVGSSSVDLNAPPVGPHPRASHAVRPRDEPSGTLLASVALHGIGLAPVGIFNTGFMVSATGYELPNAYPYGVTINSNFLIYVVDAGNCVIQQIQGTVTIVAGTTCGPAAGDGGPATAAVLSDPLRLAIDGAGNLYIADGESHTVREVNALTGIISTVAGTGAASDTGDGDLAINATFEEIEAIVLDAEGNGYIADTASNRVRRIDSVTGIITTIAGTGLPGYTGDGAAATSAALHGPDALALDLAGNLYIADDGNNVIRKLVLRTGIITTIAGTGTAGYAGDGGPATSAQLNDPEGIGVDIAGNLYIADAQNFVVRKVAVNTGIITTAAGKHSATESYTGDSGPAPQAGMSYLEDVAVASNGILLITDADNGVVRVVIGPEGMTNFGSTALGSVSTAQDTILSNVGNLPLVMSGLQPPPDFTLGGADTTCTSSTTLDSGDDCALGLELVPAADGALSGVFIVDADFNNVPGTEQPIFLTGTGTGSLPAKLSFAGSVPTITAGGNLGTVAVDVEDSSGNLSTAANVTVTLTITGPGGYSHTVTVTAVNGIASFNLSGLPLGTVGTYTLTATSTNLTQAQTTASVIAGGGSPSTPAELVIPNTVPTSIQAGGNLGVVPVDIENSSAALLTGANNPVTLTITGPGGYTHTVTVTAAGGVANFNFSSLALTTPGTYTLVATSPGLASATATLTVTTGNPAVPVLLVIASRVPATIAAGGNPGVVKVDLDSSSGSVIAGATNSITLTLTGPGGFTYTVTVAAVNGVATFDLSSVLLSAPGTYTLTATSGHLTSAIATMTVTVDFTIVVTSNTPASSIIPPGTVAGFSFTLAPASGSFASPITLTATGLPAGATYTFSPAAVTPGASPAATVMSIQTVRYGSASLRTGAGTLALALLLLPIAALRRARRAWRRAGLLSLLLPLLLLGAIAGLSGCGAGGFFGQPQQTYTITVTGTSGQISHSATVTLTVQ